MTHFWPVACFVLVCGLSPTFGSEVEWKADVAGFQEIAKPFLSTYCLDCHGAKKSEGELRLDGYSADFLKEQSWDVWHEVLDQINSNHMPPKKKAKVLPQVEERLAMVEWLDGELLRVRIALENSGSMPAMRRMNRSEYQNTIRDLMGLPYDDVIHYPQLVHEFPEDPTAEGFDTAAAALMVSSLHMEKYLKQGRLVVDAALARPVTHHWRVDFCEVDTAEYRRLIDEFGVSTYQDGAFRTNLRKDRGDATFREIWPLYDRVSGKNIYDQQYVDGSVYVIDRDRKSRIEWNTCVRFEVQESGIYRFVLRGRLAGEVDGPVLLTLQRGSKREYAVRQFEVANREFETFELQEFLAKGTDVQFMADVGRIGRRESTKGLRYEVDFVEVEGPLRATDDAEQRSFLGTSDDVSERKWTEADAKRHLKHFAARAWRRPVPDADVGRVLEQYDTALEASGDAVEALKETMGWLLASPEFIHLAKPEDTAEYALASRLSYFLWSSMPDDELLELAKSGELSKPEVLKVQVDRMLDDRKAEAFVRNFCGQWLLLRQIAEVTPDRNIYPEYNENLMNNMTEETYQFFGELLREDLSVLNFIDSDFAMLNEELARFYRFRTEADNRNILGNRFRRVALLPEDHRGGILAHASILKLTSTCTRVSPVKRGAFILENLLGVKPSPPPANVEEIVSEPPGTGPTTLREMLDRHRTEATCAACHAEIDPLGFALHHYDAIGAYRTHEGSGKDRNRDNTGGAIDATGTLPDGRSFDGLDEFKAILLQDKEMFTRCLTKKLLTYALGRPTHPGDTRDIDQIQRELAESDYRFRALIQAIVRSKPFKQP